MKRCIALGVLLVACSASLFAQDVSLKDVHRLFIEKMPNDLDMYIGAEITKQFDGRLRVVLDNADADGILRGTSAQKDGVGAAITGRYLGLHDNATGSVSLGVSRLRASPISATGWILWEHTTYKRFFEKTETSDLVTWEIFGGFDSSTLCYSKAESLFHERDVFLSRKPTNDPKEPVMYLGATPGSMKLEYHVDLRKLAEKPSVSGPIAMVTYEHFVCLPSDFEPREKR